MRSIMNGKLGSKKLKYIITYQVCYVLCTGTHAHDDT